MEQKHSTYTSPESANDTKILTESAWSRRLKHPAITVISVFLAIFGIALSVYFYYASIRSPEIQIRVHPIRSTIETPKSLSSLTISWEKKEVQQRITIYQVAIWNGGRAPVRNEDVLEQIKLEMPEGTRLLDATVIQQTRDVCEFSVQRKDERFAEVNWKILEYRDGALVQMVVAGEPKDGVRATGTVVEQGPPLFTDRPLETDSVDRVFRKRHELNWLDFVGFVYAVVAGYLYLVTRFRVYKRYRNKFASGQEGQPLSFLKYIVERGSLVKVLIVFGVLIAVAIVPIVIKYYRGIQFGPFGF